ncbi:MAG: calcium/sodium antiporter [Gemmatimonadota bacterium]|jgi:cation:H+ antiporter
MTSTTIGLFVAGVLAVVGGAELVVRGGSRFARALGVRPLVVGLTLVAFGTSAPEIAVSVEAAVAGNAGVALGNVAGSNIFNVLLVLGVAAIISPLVVERQLVRMDVPVLIGVSTLPLLFGLDHRLGRIEGGILLLLGFAYAATLAFLAFRNDASTSRRKARRSGTPDAAPREARPPTGLGPRALDLLFMLVGLGALVVGADWFIRAATEMARAMGISDLVIGLTLVAAATSLPELATSLMAVVRGERDLAVGNAVGSNIFNILFVLGASAAVSPDGLYVPVGALTFDLPVVLAVALACLPVFFTGWQITRWEGGVLVAYYALYLTYLLLDASTHDMEDEFVSMMLVFVLPLTLIMVGGGWWLGRRARE